MRNIMFLISLFTLTTATAQWTTDLTLNTLVASSNTDDIKTIGTSDGGTYVVSWKPVGSPANYELRVQLLDSLGNQQFGTDGTLISNSISMSTYTVVSSVSVDANDNLYVGVTGTGNTMGHAFKLNSSGTNLWGSNGLTFSGGYLVTILPLSNGEAIVSWNPSTQTLMQKYDAGGNAIWAAPKAVTSGSSKTFSANLFELSGGDYAMIFHTYNFGINSTLYAQKFDSSGVAQWSSPSQLSNKTTAFNKIYSGTQDKDTLYFGYSGKTGSQFDSYLQRINPDGTTPWGINGKDFDVNSTNLEMDTRIASAPGSQYVWAICTYSNPSQSQNGEYIQKFDKNNGARQFSNNAKIVYPISNSYKQHASELHLVNDQPLFLLQKNITNGIGLDVVRLDSIGDFVAAQTKEVATYTANKSRTYLTKPVNEQAVAVFVENKGAGNKVYAQNYKLNALPAQPILNTPLDNAINIPLVSAFNWLSASGAATYHLQIATDATFTNLVEDQTGLTSTTYNATLPNYLTTYYWRVKASNTIGNSSWSNVWELETQMPAPNQPTLNTPLDNAINIPLANTFNWFSVTGATTYQLQVATDASFTTLVENQSGLTDTTHSATLPNYLTTYYWRVKATNATGNSAWSNVWELSTIQMPAPNQPTLNTPMDNAVNIPLTNTFNWFSTVGAATYHLQVATDASFMMLVDNQVGLTDTTHNATLPNYLTKYYWRVKATNSTGDSGWSDVWELETQISAPNQPILNTPMDNAVNVPLATTFNWFSTSGATTYDLQVAEDITFTTLTENQIGLTDTTYNATLPNNFTTYYWRVKATNTTGNSDWSDIWELKTEVMISVEDLKVKYGLKLYPNPAKEVTFIEFNSPVTSEMEFNIYNSLGSLVATYHKNIVVGENLIEVDLKDFPAGVYYYQIKKEALNLGGKFLILD